MVAISTGGSTVPSRVISEPSPQLRFPMLGLRGEIVWVAGIGFLLLAIVGHDSRLNPLDRGVAITQSNFWPQGDVVDKKMK